MTTVTTRRIEGPVPLVDHRPPLVWLSPQMSFVGHGTALRVDVGVGPERFARAQAEFEAWRHEVEGDGLPIAMASFTFDDRSTGSVLVVPEITIGRRGGDWFVTVVGDRDPTPLFHPAGTGPAPAGRPRYAGASIPDVDWLERVARTIALIAEGRAEKVVLARDYAVWSKTPFDPRRLLSRLHERFPECFTFLVDGLVGASPEMLVRRNGTAVESLALAGTARRSPDPEEDRMLAKELLASDKNRREHESAARSVADRLGGLCQRVVGDAEPSLLELANVHHLATRFRGVLARPHTALEVAAALHPTAAVGGTPTSEAVELIRTLEGMDRGRYAGPVGWVDGEGDGEFAIALRCAELSGARARLFAGAGIVRGSLPEAELEETRIKLEAMLAALD